MSSLALHRKVAQMERRRTSRPVVDIPVLFKTISGEQECQMANISDHGAKLEMPDPPVEGVCGFLVLDGEEIYCKVIWSGEGICGIEFEKTLGDYSLKQIVGAQNSEAPTANTGRIPAGRKRSGLVSRS